MQHASLNSWTYFFNDTGSHFEELRYPPVWLARLRLQMSVARRRHGSLWRNKQGEFWAAFLFQYSFFSLRFQHHNFSFQHQHLVARCSSSIHNCQQSTSDHNWLPHKQTTNHIWKKKDVSFLSISLSPFCQRTSHSWHRKQRINSYVWGATQQSHPYSLAKCKCAHQTNFTISNSRYKLANARRPLHLLTFLVA